MSTAIQDIATIQHMLQYLKEKVSPEKWDATPLPIIAAPPIWLEKIAAEVGVAIGEGNVIEVHGCSVVTKPELQKAVLIDHDGKIYPIELDWKVKVPDMAPKSRIYIQ